MLDYRNVCFRVLLVQDYDTKWLEQLHRRRPTAQHNGGRTCACTFGPPPRPPMASRMTRRVLQVPNTEHDPGHASNLWQWSSSSSKYCQRKRGEGAQQASPMPIRGRSRAVGRVGGYRDGTKKAPSRPGKPCTGPSAQCDKLCGHGCRGWHRTHEWALW